MRLYDTARQAVVPFEPGPLVTIYTCGITPYDATHLGHATVYVTYDVLQRRLHRPRPRGTRCVRNITDVDDPLLAKARELGVHYLDLAAGEVARFDEDMAALDVLPVFSEPRATSAIPDIRGFIGMVLDRGHAYEAGGSVYFDVTTLPALRRRQPLQPRSRCSRTPASGAAPSTTRTSATRSTSCCGSRRRPTSRRGRRCGDRAGPAGTSSARRWRCASSAPPSTSTAAAPT